MRYVTPVIKWGKKVGPKVWSATKEAPGKAKKYATDAFSKAHQSDQYRKASDAINSMKFVTLGEVGKKFTTKTGIGISAGVAGGTVGYMAGKKKNKRYG
jgi:formylmethanofuran:tetrahydromethanopterin formyltransferase